MSWRLSFQVARLLWRTFWQRWILLPPCLPSLWRDLSLLFSLRLSVLFSDRLARVRQLLLVPGVDRVVIRGVRALVLVLVLLLVMLLLARVVIQRGLRQSSRS